MKAIKFGMSALAVMVAVGASFVSTEAKSTLVNYDYVLVSDGTIIPNTDEATAQAATGCGTPASILCARAYVAGRANQAAFAVPAENIFKQ
ncbi:DUF6520 family protein [Chitinophaga horti]|uniref:DUF6520 family protein n=1 Tax=Chitinophaga horti TaxID=2920382 RepID=A0ABY6J7Z0_9BACT|nr:DUF6520 family protein [Chitinophaga horti]UYQ94409.1 DUF6520 family protein [Chitinophaga horti]